MHLALQAGPEARRSSGWRLAAARDRGAGGAGHLLEQRGCPAVPALEAARCWSVPAVSAPAGSVRMAGVGRGCRRLSAEAAGPARSPLWMVKDCWSERAGRSPRPRECLVEAARCTSGDEGLDLILGGGLPVNGMNMIMGLPGSGKTLLCQQLMFSRVTDPAPRDLPLDPLPAVRLKRSSSPLHAQLLRSRCGDRPIGLGRGDLAGSCRRRRARRGHREDRGADR